MLKNFLTTLPHYAQNNAKMLSEVQNVVNVTLSSENPSNLKNTARNDMIDENFGEL